MRKPGCYRIIMRKGAWRLQVMTERARLLQVEMEGSRWLQAGIKGAQKLQALRTELRGSRLALSVLGCPSLGGRLVALA